MYIHLLSQCYKLDAYYIVKEYSSEEYFYAIGFNAVWTRVVFSFLCADVNLDILQQS